jgi:ribosomal protein L7/L12
MPTNKAMGNMKSIFNENGVPDKSVDEACAEISTIVRNLFDQMQNDGYSIAEMRAVGCCFMQDIGCEVSAAVLTARFNIVEAKQKNADPRLDDEEIAFFTEDIFLAACPQTRWQNKLKAIKHYRERTGLGLKESKDAVEKWMSENLAPITEALNEN